VLDSGSPAVYQHVMLTEDLLQDARGIAERITALRRAIHSEPELGLETPKTLAKVKAELADLPLEWREGPSCTGAVAVLNSGKEGRSVVLRGDMDALPMKEETGLPFASTVSGRMHACGHDTHTAMLAGAARVLSGRADSLPGEVRFMFQPGEEGYHGARFMLDDGLLDPLPDAAFALHIMPNAPHGTIGSRVGTLLASADMLDIVVEGRGGHASMPHDTRDPVPVACEIVMALQAMVTRRFSAHEAMIVTITQLEASTAHNVIPDRATLKGTIRTLTADRRKEVWSAIRSLAENIAQAHECDADVTVTEGFPPTVNDARAVAMAEAVATSLPHGEFLNLPAPIMGAEDFSYVLEKVPGMMAFLGVAESGADWRHCCAIHSSHMIVDESVLPRGTAFLAGCASRFLERGWD
jgi:hippurate hydrolase